jgi:SAM-dependent methyltransferase
MSLTLATPALCPVAEKRVNSTFTLLLPNIKRQVQQFWQKTPCDSWFTNEPRGTLAFYRSLDEHRYKVHPRLQSAVGFERTRGLRVLEIGCGCGSEAERFAGAGAHYTAVDLTNAALRSGPSDGKDECTPASATAQPTATQSGCAWRHSSSDSEKR